MLACDEHDNGYEADDKGPKLFLYPVALLLAIGSYHVEYCTDTGTGLYGGGV